MSTRKTIVLKDNLAEKIENEASELDLNQSEVIRNHLARSITEDK